MASVLLSVLVTFLSSSSSRRQSLFFSLYLSMHTILSHSALERLRSFAPFSGMQNGLSSARVNTGTTIVVDDYLNYLTERVNLSPVKLDRPYNKNSKIINEWREKVSSLDKDGQNELNEFLDNKKSIKLVWWVYKLML